MNHLSHPIENRLVLTKIKLACTYFWQADCEGSYTLNQFFARQARLELIHKSTCPVADISVVKVTPMVTIVKPPEDLLVGIEQPIQLVIRTGSIAFDKV